MLGNKRIQRRSLIESMSVSMRLTVAALSALTLTIIIVFAGLLYRVRTIPNPAMVPAAAQTTQVGTTSASNEASDPNIEVIAEEAVPLAAPGAVDQRGGTFPVHLVLGFAIGFAAVFYITHIMRVNASISDMQSKTR